VAVHTYTLTTHRTTQITYVEECGPCPVIATFTLAFAVQLSKKHGKTSVTVRKTSVRFKKTSEYSILITKTPTQAHTLQNPHTKTHTHTLQNNLKPPQYKLKQTQCKIYASEIVTI
jgi:hypothetical protein